VQDFHTHGGGAIEIYSGFQTPDQLVQLQRLAQEFDLAASAGSDFHRDSNYGADVGVDITRFSSAPGIWERFAPAVEAAQ
jgi:hypothetical protein